MFRTRIVLTLLISFAQIASLAESNSPTVNTNRGTVEGVLDGNIQIYRGIPYAQPPVNDLRWRATQTKLAWEGTLDTSEYGPSCPQPSADMSGQSEDCLTLNVWTPAQRDEPLPVMVWIHGGGHVIGSGEIDGRAFARDGIVLVSINYRLGVLGIFAHPDLSGSLADGETTGNFHTLDQIEALKWVQDEIRHFGGDPDRVTIFGESAGGANVNLLMISPLSKGLFHGAIAQSGGNGLSNFQTLEARAEVGKGLVDAKGLKDFSELMTKHWMEIIAVPPTFQFNYSPFIDGKVIVESTKDAFSHGRQHDVPYIAGSNSFEASLKAVLPIPTFDVVLQQNQEIIAQAYGMKPDDQALSMAFYGDALFGAPTRYLVAQMKNVSAPGWRYYFDHVISTMREHVPGASHAMDIPYVFDTVETVEITPQISSFTAVPPGTYVPTEDDRKMASQVHQYWVQFGKTLEPIGEDLPAWPVYQEPNPRTMVFSNDGILISTDLHKPQMDWIESNFPQY